MDGRHRRWLQTKQKILAALEELSAKSQVQGAPTVKVTDIVEITGLSVATIYRFKELLPNPPKAGITASKAQLASAASRISELENDNEKLLRENFRLNQLLRKHHASMDRDLIDFSKERLKRATRPNR